MNEQLNMKGQLNDIPTTTVPHRFSETTPPQASLSTCEPLPSTHHLLLPVSPRGEPVGGGQNLT